VGTSGGVLSIALLNRLVACVRALPQQIRVIRVAAGGTLTHHYAPSPQHPYVRPCCAANAPQAASGGVAKELAFSRGLPPLSGRAGGAAKAGAGAKGAAGGGRAPAAGRGGGAGGRGRGRGARGAAQGAGQGLGLGLGLGLGGLGGDEDMEDAGPLLGGLAAPAGRRRGAAAAAGRGDDDDDDEPGPGEGSQGALAAIGQLLGNAFGGGDRCVGAAPPCGGSLLRSAHALGMSGS
jgi:hypothetical protein